MRKVFIVLAIFAILLVGCDKQIRPIEVIETDFDIDEAEVIMKRAWKPIHEMTNSNSEVKPNIPISSKEEFLKKYDFSYMDERIMIDLIYESIVDFDKDGEVKDETGNLVYLGSHIPTVYDENMVIEEAFLRKSIHQEKYSFLDNVELIIVESNSDRTNFTRKNIFRKDEKGKWILYIIERNLSYL